MLRMLFKFQKRNEKLTNFFGFLEDCIGTDSQKFCPILREHLSLVVNELTNIPSI